MVSNAKMSTVFSAMSSFLLSSSLGKPKMRGVFDFFGGATVLPGAETRSGWGS